MKNLLNQDPNEEIDTKDFTSKNDVVGQVLGEDKFTSPLKRRAYTTAALGAAVAASYLALPIPVVGAALVPATKLAVAAVGVGMVAGVVSDGIRHFQVKEEQERTELINAIQQNQKKRDNFLKENPKVQQILGDILYNPEKDNNIRKKNIALRGFLQGVKGFTNWLSGLERFALKIVKSKTIAKSLEHEMLNKKSIDAKLKALNEINTSTLADLNPKDRLDYGLAHASNSYLKEVAKRLQTETQQMQRMTTNNAMANEFDEINPRNVKRLREEFLDDCNNIVQDTIKQDSKGVLERVGGFFKSIVTSQTECASTNSALFSQNLHLKGGEYYNDKEGIMKIAVNADDTLDKKDTAIKRLDNEEKSTGYSEKQERTEFLEKVGKEWDERQKKRKQLGEYKEEQTTTKNKGYRSSKTTQNDRGDYWNDL